jgi:hypothetical protein
MVALYVKRGEQIFGPFSIEQLKAGAQNGQVKSGDAISQSTDGPWTQVEQVKGLVLKGAAAAIVQPTLPPVGPDPSAVDPPGDPVSPITPIPTVHAQQAQSPQQVSAANKTTMKITAVFHRWFLHGNRKIFSAIGLSLVVGLLVLSFFVNQANNRTANEELDKFRQEVSRLGGVFQGFEKGIVSTRTAALELNSGRDTLREQAGALAGTGRFLGMGSWGFWGTDQELIDAHENEWMAAYTMMIEITPKIVGKAQVDALAGMKPIEEGGTQESAIRAAEEDFIKSLGGYEQMQRQALSMGTTFNKLKEDFQEDAKGN